MRAYLDGRMESRGRHEYESSVGHEDEHIRHLEPSDWMFEEHLSIEELERTARPLGQDDDHVWPADRDESGGTRANGGGTFTALV